MLSLKYLSEIDGASYKYKIGLFLNNIPWDL